jgi:hypothetical protein
METARFYSLVDRWNNHWLKFNPVRNKHVSITELQNSEFFDLMDKAFKLLQTSQSSLTMPLAKKDSLQTYADILFDVSNNYFIARTNLKNPEIAALEAKVFSTFIPVLKAYKRKDKNPLSVHNLITDFNTFNDADIAEKLLDTYNQILNSGLVDKEEYEAFNRAFRYIVHPQQLKKQELKLFQRITFSMMQSFKDAPLNDLGFVKRFAAFTKVFQDFVNEPYSQSFFELISRLSKHPLFYKNKSAVVNSLFKTDLLATFSHLKKNPLQFNAFIDILDSLSKTNASIYTFFNYANKVFAHSKSPQLRDIFVQMCKYFNHPLRQWSVDLIPAHLLDLARYSDKDLKIPLENYKNALENNVFNSAREALGNLGDIIVAQEVVNRTQDQTNKSKLLSLNLDQVPWPQAEFVKLQRAYQQNFDILRKAINRHRSSTADAYLCRKVGSQAPLYEQFLQDWMRPTVFNIIINQGWHDSNFPGNGWFIADSELSTTVKDFVATATSFPVFDINGESLDDKSSYDRAYKILGVLEASTITRLRGLTIITPSEDAKYELINSKSIEPYSFIFYNEHYANPTNTKALLVPSSVIKENHKFEDFQEKLRPEVLRRHKDVLDLGSMSVFNGGLCNARKPYSKPFFIWEDHANYAPDSNGHKHKYNIRTEYDIMAALQEDHLRIFDIANNFFTMMFQVDVLESLFIKGAQNSEDELRYDFENLLDVFDAWSAQYQHKAEKNPAHSAVLVDADVFDKTSKPNWTLRLDPEKQDYSTREAKNKNQIASYDLSNEFIDRYALLSSRLAAPDRTARFYPRNNT